MDSIDHKILRVNGINMHVAIKGPEDGPVVLLVHGFPELRYSWRHQIVALAALGYQAVTPDLRGFGDTDVPLDPIQYTSLHVVGNLVALIDAVSPGDQKVFVVGHDFGAYMMWKLCMFRPDKIRALVNLSVNFLPRDPCMKIMTTVKATYRGTIICAGSRTLGRLKKMDEGWHSEVHLPALAPGRPHPQVVFHCQFGGC